MNLFYALISIKVAACISVSCQLLCQPLSTQESAISTFLRLCCPIELMPLLTGLADKVACNYASCNKKGRRLATLNLSLTGWIRKAS